MRWFRSRASSDRVRRAAPIVALIVGLVAYAAWFIWRGSIQVGSQRYFVLFDDAMVSMVYAKNVVEGYGLNWARYGAPVEGFTCPLWTLFMIPVHWLPLSDSLRPLVVQLASLVALCANVVLISRLTERLGATRRAALMAAGLTALYFPLNFWALVGMETGLQTLLITGVILAALDGRSTAMFVLCGLAALLRPDMGILVVVCAAYLISQKVAARIPVRTWLPQSLFLIVPLGLYLGFRAMYFGDVAPNTYYLKMTGVPTDARVARGLAVFVDFARPWGVVLLVTMFGAVAASMRRRTLWLPLVVLSLYFLYSIYIGGDAWEGASTGANRFVAPVMPLLFVLNACLCDEIFSWLRERNVSSRAISALAAGVFAFVWLSVNGITSDTLGTERLRTVLVVRKPLYTRERELILKATLALPDVAREGALLAVVWAGVPAYYSTYRMTDVLGYNSRTIAHRRAHVSIDLDQSEKFLPGHMKWDYRHTLGELRQDVVFQTWELEGDTLTTTMKKYGYFKYENLWIREGSKFAMVDRPETTPPSRRLRSSIPWRRGLE